MSATRDQPGCFFEGTEKKVELVVRSSRPSLRSVGRAGWDRVVESAGAQILSVLSNRCCDAYLLSESSLFVFDHKMVLITCGRTRLPAAVATLFEMIPPEDCELLIYERKNEVYPHAQPTSFFQDVEQLQQHSEGLAYRFGDEDEHHLFVFHTDRPRRRDRPDPTPDLTVELLMYNLDDEVRRCFGPGCDPARRRALGLRELVPGFECDEHEFEPVGFSLNGIRDDEYVTVHVTPDDVGSYASFETNFRFEPGALDATVARVVGTFRPRSFDLILWERLLRVSPPQYHAYRLKTHVSQELSCGYRVRFLNFYRPQQRRVRAAVELPIVRQRV